MLEPHLHPVADLIAAHPDRTLAELKDALATPASVPTVWRAVRALGLTVKKTVRPKCRSNVGLNPGFSERIGNSRRTGSDDGESLHRRSCKPSQGMIP